MEQTASTAQPFSGIVRPATARGARIPLCYDCDQQQTGGAYFGQDEYGDGHGWIPLAEGESYPARTIS